MDQLSAKGSPRRQRSKPRFRQRLAEHGVTHRRGGYRDPESQAFIESWFSKLKERLIWRSEFDTHDQAREEAAAYINRYHHRPHSGLRYRTPAEVRKTREDGQALVKHAAGTVHHDGVQATDRPGAELHS